MKDIGYMVEIFHQDKSDIVHVSGRINSMNYESFLEKCLFDGTDRELILDMDGLDYISSAGIRVLIFLAKKYREGFSVVNVAPYIMEVLETTGITAIISVKATVNSNGEKNGSITGRESGFRTLLKAGRDRLMVMWNGEAYTYAIVDRISQLIVADLHKLDVKRYSHVAICALDSLNMICTFLAIQKLGAVAVMMNPACTLEEIKRLTDEGDVTHICYESTAIPFALPNLKTYYIGNEIDFRERLSDTPSIAEISTENFDPDDPCVMFFTSGSTGVPKAALHSFHSMCRGVEQLIKVNHLNDNDRLCHTQPFFHIGGMMLDLMSTLMTGASLYFVRSKPDSNIIERMECILDTVEKYGCTVMNAIPTTLFSICGLTCFSQERIRTLRYSITGAMPITRLQMKLLCEKYSHMKLIVIYGMTELLPATLVSSEDTWEHLVSTVGRPVVGVEVKIRTPDGRLCSPYETGEICIWAEQTMTCYYKADTMKQPLDDSGFIRSGDFGYMDEEGYLHIEGRIKDIIIRGGENIVPGEIEEAIAGFDEIRYVYVCGVPDDIMGEKVAAAVVMKDGCRLDASWMKKSLLRKLAKHKIPSCLMEVNSFPLLPSGKIDKVVLKKMLTDYSRSCNTR